MSSPDESLSTPSIPTIPAPPSNPAPPDPLSLKELENYTNQNSWRLRYGKADWALALLLKVIFAAAALFINVWWDRHVLAMLWQAGRQNSGFRLSDGVLIALVTTSVANFLALIAIVMRNLFPSRGVEETKSK